MFSFRRLSLFTLLAAACCLPHAASGADTNRPVVTLTARPVFVRESSSLNSRWLVIQQANERHCYAWPGLPNVEGYSIDLNTNQTYTFTVGTKVSYYSDTVSTNAELLTIQQDGHALYDRAVCAVHHARMTYRTVPLVFDAHPAAEVCRPHFPESTRTFPHWKDFVSSPLAGRPGIPKTTQIYQCAQYKAAFDQWLQGYKTAWPAWKPDYPLGNPNPALK